MDTSFLSGANAVYIAEVYSRYLNDPASVDPGWRAYFQDLRGDDPAALAADLIGPSWQPRGNRVVGAADPEAPAPAAAGGKGRDSAGREGDGGKRPAAAAAASGLSEAEARQHTLDSIRALMMIRAYRVRGHLMANLDPLGLFGQEPHPELDYRSYGFTEADLDREIFIDHVLGMERATLRKIVEVVQETYCGTIGVEFMHIQFPDQKAWIQRRIEGERNHTKFTPEGKRAILERLIEAEEFEKFLQVKYTGTKRFGLEGGETLIPALEQIIKRGSQLGVRDITFGMAHRGRLNVLTAILHKPYRAIFSEFQGNSANPEDVQGSGDVKYHLGTSGARVFDGVEVHLSLQANPSHLEAVDPVVLGKVRAKQTQEGDLSRTRTLAVLIHGDAAFAGQGIVAECFGLSRLKGYRTGGTIHVVVNNQIGFTTSPQYSRSGQYCTDIAKMVQAPILHVNGDDPEAVVHAARIATEFRQEFGVDVVVDMVCYRRHGHNEIDEPAFTQPLMYKQIRNRSTTRVLYAQALAEDGVVPAAEAQAMTEAFARRLDDEFQAAATYKPNRADWLAGKWEGLEAMSGEEEVRQDATEVTPDLVQEVGRALCTVPGDFDLNPKIQRLVKARAKILETGDGVDWGLGEALAFGTLLAEGVPVRLSGQDSGRGTFSHRHAVLVDQTTEDRYIPLETIRPDQARFEVIDSPLSEFSVLGFEYGYSLAEPRGLVVWEAQFGDFANGAQVIFDQFISSAESKWLRMSGLVLLLPHGYEGQGPEHSSARPERYLQLCGQDNMQVVIPTTPANYFHALRRQVKRNFRKPLIVMTPKSLLRHKRCVSDMAALTGHGFRRVIGETRPTVRDEAVRRAVLCTGKVYYDLLEACEQAGRADIALIRIEQLYPWPKEAVLRELRRHPGAEVVWCQEEPANMGAWTFVDRRLDYVLEDLDHSQRRVGYAGRAAAASPATGSQRAHAAEQALLVDQALSWRLEDLTVPFRRATPLSTLR